LNKCYICHRPPATTLWEKAVQKLSQADRASIDWTNTSKIDILKEVKKKATDLQEQHAAKQRTFTWNGREIKIVDTASKLVKYIDKFASIGDIVIQYDPVHAALPWAGFRLLIQVSYAYIYIQHKKCFLYLTGATKGCARRYQECGACPCGIGKYGEVH